MQALHLVLLLVATGVCAFVAVFSQLPTWNRVALALIAAATPQYVLRKVLPLPEDECQSKG